MKFPIILQVDKKRPREGSVISFSDQDSEGIQRPHDDALVGSGRKSITERVETDMGTVAPTMSTMMLSLLPVLSPVNAVMCYFPNLRV
jgi:hypothetical protein